MRYCRWEEEWGIQNKVSICKNKNRKPWTQFGKAQGFKKINKKINRHFEQPFTLKTCIHMHKCPGCVCEGQEVCRPPLEGLGNQAVQHFVALTSACTHTGEGLPCGCVGTTQQPHPKLCRHPYKTKPKCSCTTNSITFLSSCSFSVHDRPVYSKKKRKTEEKKKPNPQCSNFFEATLCPH